MAGAGGGAYGGRGLGALDAEQVQEGGERLSGRHPLAVLGIGQLHGGQAELEVVLWV